MNYDIYNYTIEDIDKIWCDKYMDLLRLEYIATMIQQIEYNFKWRTNHQAKIIMDNMLQHGGYPFYRHITLWFWKEESFNIWDILLTQPHLIEQYKSWKESVINSMIWLVMKETKWAISIDEVKRQIILFLSNT